MKHIKGWLISNGCLKTGRFMEIIEMYQEAAALLNIGLEVIYNNELLMGIENNNLILRGKKVEEKPQFVLFLDKDIRLAKQLEGLGLRLFNKAEVIALCDDKSETFRALAGHGITMPKTIVAPLVFNGMQEEGTYYIEQIEEELGYPHIIKESFGSFGEQVYLIKDREELMTTRNRLLSTPHLYQAFVETSKGKDIRLNVVGGEVVATMLRSSETDFRANIAKGGKAESYTPDISFIQMALKVCELIGADFAGVDLLFGPEGAPILCEVNSNAHIKGIKACTGINVAEKILEYIRRTVS